MQGINNTLFTQTVLKSLTANCGYQARASHVNTTYAYENIKPCRHTVRGTRLRCAGWRKKLVLWPQLLNCEGRMMYWLHGTGPMVLSRPKNTKICESPLKIFNYRRISILCLFTRLHNVTPKGQSAENSISGSTPSSPWNAISLFLPINLMSFHLRDLAFRWRGFI